MLEKGGARCAHACVACVRGLHAHTCGGGLLQAEAFN